MFDDDKNLQNSGTQPNGMTNPYSNYNYGNGYSGNSYNTQQNNSFSYGKC